MIIHLLSKEKIKNNTKRWSFRFGSLTTITVACVGAWNLMPDAWRPQFSETVKYYILGVVFLFAILSNISHLFVQQEVTPTPTPTQAPPVSTDIK